MGECIGAKVLFSVGSVTFHRWEQFSFSLEIVLLSGLLGFIFLFLWILSLH